ncbi:ribosomal protein L30 [Cryptococcus sp. DSM 104548]
MFSRRIPSALRAYSTSVSPEAPSQATHHLITLVRSPIALPERSKRTLNALGLKRLRQSVLHPFSPVVAGRILKVKELVQVLNVTEEEGMVLSERRRGEGSGVEVSGRAFGGGKGSVEVQI